MGGRTGGGVCAGLGGVAKGPQIGLHDFGPIWTSNYPVIPDSCRRIVTGSRLVALTGASRMGRDRVFLSSRVFPGSPVLPSRVLAWYHHHCQHHQKGTRNAEEGLDQQPPDL